MPETKRVAVIGAGPCGLGAVKALKDEGLEPVCFERTGHLGGLWRYHDDDVNGIASVMKTTIINTSKELGAASDCPPPAEYPNYMHHTLMYDYIKSLAEKFDCVRHIRYHHETLKIDKADDYEKTGRWVVTNKNTQTGEVISEVFDCVTVCIGHHVYPNEPTFPGQEEFNGKIMHTHSLKKVDGFEDRRVVVVGVGNSGMDAAVELSAVASKVYLSSRRGAWVLPRVGPKGHPFDAAFVRRYFNLLQRYLPYDLVCNFSEKQLNERFNHTTYNLKPKHRVWSQHPTVSDTLPIKLLSGTVVVRNGIHHFTKNGVVFEGEKDETEVDAVILATGYRVKFPFLSDDILPVKDNRVQLYKFIYPPHLPHPTLAILGLIQPSGPGFPVGEMQCRWTARIMSGHLNLPPKEQMYADIRKREEFIRKRFVDSPRHTLQVDFIGYQDELAEEIGAKPNLLKLALTDPKLFWAVFFGPSLPYQYRLQGPHTWEGARDAILTYKERVYAPFQKPGQEIVLRKKKIISGGTIAKLFFLLPLIWYFFLNVAIADF
ncbi:flavin-containing monooxygenase 5-like [Uloborus diversus]|uniref:flavin-containing monooxygenase 5-like n=1 Tax=Uloborus diversus TaxID=327109 RepID=UPI0024091F3F|nr:flavin-containing monooxygenase 5-like [Uloborus diversus]XP_054708614.1 flavin-containing monooxygenase 5-like [Uloborus diversus]XP_054708615.1 flavin-containing monooxygenase 5-like [Uloborus diversus]